MAKIFKLAFVPLLSMVFLFGCAGKQPSGPVAEVEQTDELPDINAPLSSHEIAVLKSSGQIDKNVPDEAMNDVAREYRHYLRKGRSTMCAFSRQSEKYLSYARNVFRSRGMPEELANLAIVESGYRPEARSRAGAAGAWQFMPETGLRYGLAQDWWQDERLDPWHATEAAADYLRKLYENFGDWPTAIAAYNAGEGKISRACEGSGGKDFFEVNLLNDVLDDKTRLRDETRQYVPRFLAISKIMRNLPELGFEPVDADKPHGISRLEAAPGTSLKELARACNLNWPEFASHNRHHKRVITCTERPTWVYVPSHLEKLAADYLARQGKPMFAGWRPVAVANSRESLEKICARTKTPLELLKAANPDASRLKRGQVILVPGATVCLLSPTSPKINLATPNTDKSAFKASSSRGNQSSTGPSHIIAQNETLYSISNKYNVSVAELMSHNGIESAQGLRIGQSLIIPAKGRHKGSIGKRKPNLYKVRANDNLWRIAQMHRVSVNDLKRWNGIDEKTLKAGAQLVVSEE